MYRHHLCPIVVGKYLVNICLFCPQQNETYLPTVDFSWKKQKKRALFALCIQSKISWINQFWTGPSSAGLKINCTWELNWIFSSTTVLGRKSLSIRSKNQTIQCSQDRSESQFMGTPSTAAPQSDRAPFPLPSLVFLTCCLSLESPWWPVAPGCWGLGRRTPRRTCLCPGSPSRRARRTRSRTAGERTDAFFQWCRIQLVDAAASVKR